MQYINQSLTCVFIIVFEIQENNKLMIVCFTNVI